MPGQRVEVAVQVRKGGTAAAAAPTPVQPVLSWVSPFEALVGWDLRSAREPWLEVVGSDDDLVHIRERYPSDPPVTTGWRGTPWRLDGDRVPYPSSGPDWRCELIECTVSMPDFPPPACYTGFVAGVAPERVTWLLEWDMPYDGAGLESVDVDWGDAVSMGGQVARAVGCTVMVYPLWHGGSGDGRDTLTATAMVDGKAVGVLTFVAIYIGW